MCRSCLVPKERNDTSVRPPTQQARGRPQARPLGHRAKAGVVSAHKAARACGCLVSEEGENPLRSARAKTIRALPPAVPSDDPTRRRMRRARTSPRSVSRRRTRSPAARTACAGISATQCSQTTTRAPAASRRGSRVGSRVSAAPAGPRPAAQHARTAPRCATARPDRALRHVRQAVSTRLGEEVAVEDR